MSGGYPRSAEPAHAALPEVWCRQQIGDLMTTLTRPLVHPTSGAGVRLTSPHDQTPRESGPRCGFLLDMDGVIYRGDEPVPGAAEFIHSLRERAIPFLFLTNNSASGPRDYVVKLHKMGIEVEEEHFYTCGMATMEFLHQQKPLGTAFVIGEGGLVSALHQAGYGITSKQPDYVIVGEGRTLNFEMAEKAMMMLLNGAHLIATNLDVSCPTATGSRPGCGAIVAMLEAATGRRAYSVGKPSPFMMRAARKRLGLRTAETIMVGDTMETDIRGSLELGFQAILVLTGSTAREKLSGYPFQPTLVVDSIAEIDLAALSAFST
jgi:NagD protein